MPSYLNELIGHFTEEQPTGGVVYGGEPPIGVYTGEDETESEKEAGVAFDKMFKETTQAYEKLTKSIYGGGKA